MFKQLAVIAMLGASVLAGCQPKGGAQDHAGGKLQTLAMSAHFAGQQLTCDSSLSVAKIPWQLSQLAFYLHDVAVKRDGVWQMAALPNTSWQHNGIALVRLAADGCTSELNSELSLSLPAALEKAEAIRFVIGVPFADNHGNPLSQPSPLNIPSMFWSWQTGHKFMRLDMYSGDDSFAFHLGSIGCTSASRVRSPQAPCKQPNLIEVELPLMHETSEADGKTAVLSLNLDALLSGLQPSAQSSCVLHRGIQDQCQVLLDNLQSDNLFQWQ